MTYEVIKYIKGNPYRYLVRSEREGDRVRQVFVRYLGRADKPSREDLGVEPVERKERIRRPAVARAVSETVAPTEVKPSIPPEVTIPRGIRPDLYVADIEGMMPETANRVKTVQLPDGNELTIMSDEGDIYGLIDGKEVGFATKLSDTETDLSVVMEYRNKGIGTELMRQFQIENPEHPTGGLTEGGKRVIERLTEIQPITPTEAVTPTVAVETETPALVEPTPPLVTKEPWQMTKVEYAEAQTHQSRTLIEAWNKAGSKGVPPTAAPSIYEIVPLAEKAGYIMPRDAEKVLKIPYHQLRVEAALKQGLPIPPEVLKEYPELAPKPTPEVMVTPIEPEITPSNPYMNMPIERVRRDATHGVKLAKEALAVREAVIPEVIPVTPEVTQELQAEYTERIKPYLEKADMEIKKVNDDFMAGKTSLAENQAQRDAINAELDKQANKVREEMGFPKAEVTPISPEVTKFAPEYIEFLRGLQGKTEADFVIKQTRPSPLGGKLWSVIDKTTNEEISASSSKKLAQDSLSKIIAQVEEVTPVTPEVAEVTAIVDAFKNKIRQEIGVESVYITGKRAAWVEALPYGKLPDGSYNIALVDNLAEKAHDELIRQGVLKVDNRIHRGLGKIPNAYRVSQSWLTRAKTEPPVTPTAPAVEIAESITMKPETQFSFIRNTQIEQSLRELSDKDILSLNPSVKRSAGQTLGISGKANLKDIDDYLIKIKHFLDDESYTS